MSKTYKNTIILLITLMFFIAASMYIANYIRDNNAEHEAEYNNIENNEIVFTYNGDGHLTGRFETGTHNTLEKTNDILVKVTTGENTTFTDFVPVAFNNDSTARIKYDITYQIKEDATGELFGWGLQEQNRRLDDSLTTFILTFTRPIITPNSAIALKAGNIIKSQAKSIEAYTSMNTDAVSQPLRQILEDNVIEQLRKETSSDIVISKFSIVISNFDGYPEPLTSKP